MGIIVSQHSRTKLFKFLIFVFKVMKSNNLVIYTNMTVFNRINFYKRPTTFNTLCHDFIRNVWVRRKHNISTKNMNKRILFRNPKMWRLPKILNLSYPLWVVFNPLCWPNEKKAALAHTCDMKPHSNIMLQPYGVTHLNLCATIFLMGLQLYLYHECPASLVLDLLT